LWHGGCRFCSTDMMRINRTHLMSIIGDVCARREKRRRRLATNTNRSWRCNESDLRCYRCLRWCFIRNCDRNIRSAMRCVEGFVYALDDRGPCFRLASLEVGARLAAKYWAHALLDGCSANGLHTLGFCLLWCDGPSRCDVSEARLGHLIWRLEQRQTNRTSRPA
jgi:hypothetical protein